MREYQNIIKHKQKIQKAIKANGYTSEHSYLNFIINRTKYKKPVYVQYSDNKGILTYKTKTQNYYMFSEPIAPENERIKVFLKFLDFIFKQKRAKKVTVEFTKEFKDELREALKKTRYRMCPLNYKLFWPLFHMHRWDHTLSGKKWKKVRNFQNRLRNYYRMRVFDSRKCKKEDLIKLIEDWKNSRKCDDEADTEMYISLIKNNFRGCDYARSVVIKGRPCTINAGWKIPNSKKHYYSAIGILNYKYEGLGEVSNVDELAYLKKRGAKVVDFGGSDDILLRFKKKFQPHNSYETHIFSIKRK